MKSKSNDVALAALTCAAMCSTAHAAEPVDAPPLGIELSARAGGLLAFPAGLTTDIGATVGYRTGHIAFGAALDCATATGQVQPFCRVGAYVHYQFAPGATFDPWLGLVPSAIIADEVGFDIAAELGLDIGTPTVAAGPYLTVSTGTLGDGYLLAGVGARLRVVF